MKKLTREQAAIIETRQTVVQQRMDELREKPERIDRRAMLPLDTPFVELDAASLPPLHYAIYQDGRLSSIHALPDPRESYLAVFNAMNPDLGDGFPTLRAVPIVITGEAPHARD